MAMGRSAFEARYRTRRAEGKAGWKDDYRDTVAGLEQALQADYAPKGGTALELGCGAGNTTLWLAERGFHAYGIDIVPAAIAWARTEAKRRQIQADFRTGNAVYLRAYPDDFFDLVVDGECLHCIVGPDRKQFLSSACRVLRPGGLFCVRTVCGNGRVKELFYQSHDVCFDPESRLQLKDGVALYYVGMESDILNEMRCAGFRILHTSLSKPTSRDDQPFIEGELVVHATKP